MRGKARILGVCEGGKMNSDHLALPLRKQRPACNHGRGPGTREGGADVRQTSRHDAADSEAA